MSVPADPSYIAAYLQQRTDRGAADDIVARELGDIGWLVLMSAACVNDYAFHMNILFYIAEVLEILVINLPLSSIHLPTYCSRWTTTR